MIIMIFSFEHYIKIQINILDHDYYPFFIGTLHKDTNIYTRS